MLSWWRKDFHPKMDLECGAGNTGQNLPETSDTSGGRPTSKPDPNNYESEKELANKNICWCPYCEKIFNSKLGQQGHINEKHNDKCHHCTLCGGKFIHRNYLISHQKIRECKICKFEVKCLKEWDKHLMMHAKPKESIGNHKNEDNNSNEFRLDCLTKEKIRKLSKLVAEEEEEKQIQSVIEDSGPKPQFCESVRHQEDIDSNKISASSQAIMLHNEKNHQCTICRKNFGLKHHLKEHQKPRNCMVCKLEIKCPQALKKHQKIHNKPKEPTYHAENDSDSNEIVQQRRNSINILRKKNKTELLVLM